MPRGLGHGHGVSAEVEGLGGQESQGIKEECEMQGRGEPQKDGAEITQAFTFLCSWRAARD